MVEILDSAAYDDELSSLEQKFNVAMDEIYGSAPTPKKRWASCVHHGPMHRSQRPKAVIEVNTCLLYLITWLEIRTLLCSPLWIKMRRNYEMGF